MGLKPGVDMTVVRERFWFSPMLAAGTCLAIGAGAARYRTRAAALGCMRAVIGWLCVYSIAFFIGLIATRGT